MSITSKKITYFLIAAIMAFSSLVVIQFSGRTMFLFLMILFVFWMLFYKKEICLSSKVLPNLILLSLIGSLASAFLSDMPFSYKKAAAFSTMYEIPLYLSFCYISKELESARKFIIC